MSKETILILDKEYQSQYALKTLLEGEEYIVIAVDAIDRAVQNFSEFVVSGLITEYSIDHQCTVEKIRELKKKSPETYVMMITDKEVVGSNYEEIIDAGVDDFFLKPVSAGKILLHLRKGLRQRLVLLRKKTLEEELNHHKGKGRFENWETGQRSLSPDG